MIGFFTIFSCDHPHLYTIPTLKTLVYNRHITFKLDPICGSPLSTLLLCVWSQKLLTECKRRAEEVWGSLEEKHAGCGRIPPHYNPSSVCVFVCLWVSVCVCVSRLMCVRVWTNCSFCWQWKSIIGRLQNKSVCTFRFKNQNVCVCVGVCVTSTAVNQLSFSGFTFLCLCLCKVSMKFKLLVCVCVWVEGRLHGNSTASVTVFRLLVSSVSQFPKTAIGLILAILIKNKKCISSNSLLINSSPNNDLKICGK